MTRLQAVRRLTILWGAVVSACGALILLQHVQGIYGEDADAAWSWVVGLTTGPFSLVVSAAFSEPTKRWCNAAASLFRSKCAEIASAAYAAALLSVILIWEPFTGREILELFEMSAIPLALVQGFVVGAVASVIFQGR